MNAFVSALRELWGLFVEDASFTLGIVVSLALATFAFPLLRVPPVWRGAGFFVLLVIVLLENTRRSARG